MWFPNNANVIASMMLDLPAPFCPTNTLVSSSNCSFVSECDRKSTNSILFIIFSPYTVQSFQLPVELPDQVDLLIKVEVNH